MKVKNLQTNTIVELTDDVMFVYLDDPDVFEILELTKREKEYLNNNGVAKARSRLCKILDDSALDKVSNQPNS